MGKLNPKLDLGRDSRIVDLGIKPRQIAKPKERSWQARYEYDFAGPGLRGLKLMRRKLYYGGQEGPEWERNTNIAYVAQSGPLKTVGLKVSQRQLSQQWWRRDRLAPRDMGYA